MLVVLVGGRTNQIGIFPPILKTPFHLLGPAGWHLNITTTSCPFCVMVFYHSQLQSEGKRAAFSSPPNTHPSHFLSTILYYCCIIVVKMWRAIVQDFARFPPPVDCLTIFPNCFIPTFLLVVRYFSFVFRKE